MSEVSAKLESQYRDIAESIEIDGLGGAITGGYISPNTDNEKLNEAIAKAIEGLNTIERIIEPYRF